MAAVLVALMGCDGDHIGIANEDDALDSSGGADVSADDTQSDGTVSTDSTIGTDGNTFTCGTATCQTGQGCCSDTCVDLGANKLNCGACGTACLASQICDQGACAEPPACPSGTGECDGDLNTSCETDVTSTATHCGACGLVCRSGEGCSNGQCVGTSCPPGRADCTGDGTCETDTGTNDSNCGQCGVVCPQGNPCRLGFCSCGFGQAICAGQCVNIQDDSNNCGRCGEVCGAQEACRFGSCQPQNSNCQLPKADCDRDPSTVCETDVSTDVNNCGTCGTVCGQSLECSFGFCRDTDCSIGTGDCDGDASNGCETNVGSDKNNCGQCGNACSTNQNCTFGFCF